MLKRKAQTVQNNRKLGVRNSSKMGNQMRNSRIRNRSDRLLLKIRNETAPELGTCQVISNVKNHNFSVVLPSRGVYVPSMTMLSLSSSALSPLLPKKQNKHTPREPVRSKHLRGALSVFCTWDAVFATNATKRHVKR